MNTALVVFFSLFPLLFFGFPITGLLFPDEPISKRWVKVPFLGLAFVVLITQNLVYADIPVKLSTLWVWGLGFIIWIGWLFLKFRKGIPHDQIKISKSSFLITVSLIIVYVVQGFGLFGSSARYYVARAWFDQYNYVALAQFLTDYRFSTPPGAVLTQPYAEKAISIKGDRIGQSVYHAFVASRSKADTKTTFEVTIFLLPILAAIAIYGIARTNYSPFAATIALLCAGILPSLAMMHLESFLSQSLGTPFLLIFPLFILEIKERFSIRSLLAAAMVLSAAISIYTEFTPLYLMEILLVFVAWFAAQVRLVRSERGRFNLQMDRANNISYTDLVYVFVRYVILIIISLLLNIGFLNGIRNIVSRTNVPGLLQGIYPWSFQLEGLTRMWFGDWSVASPGVEFFLTLLGVGMAIAAYGGLLMNWAKRKTLLNFTILVLSFLPLGLLLLGEEYRYQFYKLQLTISPLYIIGVLFWVDATHPQKLAIENTQIKDKLNLRVILLTALIIIIAISGASTFSMAYRSGVGKTQTEIGRGGAPSLGSPEMTVLANLLKSINNTDVLISVRDSSNGGGFLNGWIAYFARNNRIYLTNSRISDISAPDLSMQNINLSTLPAGSILINSAQESCGGEIAGFQVASLLENKMVHVYQISNQNWAFISQVDNSNGLEKDLVGNPFIWIGNSPASMILYAGKNGLLKIHANLRPGQSIPVETPRNLEITNLDVTRLIPVQGLASDQTIEIPVSSGRNEIKFQVIERPTQPLSKDPRTLLVMIKNYCQIEISNN
jgi:hypothetical protein